MVKRDLKKILMDNAWKVLNREGSSHLNVRTLTKLSSCALGSFYNSFESFDELLCHMNARSVALLFEALKKNLIKTLQSEEVTFKDALVSLGKGYISFSEENVNLWKALFESMAKEDTPTWYKLKVRALLKEVEDILSSHFKREPKKVHRTVTLFWAAIHGVSSIFLNKKIHVVDDLIDDDFIDYYLSHCIDGLM